MSRSIPPHLSFLDSDVGREFFCRLWRGSHCGSCFSEQLLCSSMKGIFSDPAFRQFLKEIYDLWEMESHVGRLDTISRRLESPVFFDSLDASLSLGHRCSILCQFRLALSNIVDAFYVLDSSRGRRFRRRRAGSDIDWKNVVLPLFTGDCVYFREIYRHPYFCSLISSIADEPHGSIGCVTGYTNLPKDVKAVKMIRSFTDCRGVDQVKVFTVNKGRVLRALYWLIKHHQDYRQAYERKELTIDPSNLDWMDGNEEAELPVIELRKCCADDEVDVGVSRDQCFEPDQENDDFEASGITCSENAALTSEADDAILRSLKKAAKGNSRVPSLDWPQHSNEAISEFDSTVRIFVNAFPHLFPGGVADVKEPERKIQVWISKWAKHLLLYSDGRFARDNVWCFFAYNYCLRNRNTESGSFFVNRHISNPPSSLEELQNSLRNGDYSFVNKMCYFTKRVRGSDSYWRQKRAELYNWVHYHIAEGHGAPTGFFTLSCAEYFWPDMIRLLEERVWIAEGRHRNGPGSKTDRHGNVIDLNSDRKARNKAVIDYAIVVQEFFIRRTEDYLNTVGRDLLGIEHYWCRFEFAKGRGQIHAHILVILSKKIQARIQERVDMAKGNREREAKYVSEWAKQQFGMTATFNNDLAKNR